MSVVQWDLRMLDTTPDEPNRRQECRRQHGIRGGGRGTRIDGRCLARHARGGAGVSACLLPTTSMSGKAPPKGPRALLGAHPSSSSSSSAAPHHHHHPPPPARPPPTGGSRIGATPPTGPRSLLAAAPRPPPVPKQLYSGQGSQRASAPTVSPSLPGRARSLIFFALFWGWMYVGPRELAGGACVGRGEWRRCEGRRPRGLAAAAAVVGGGDAAAKPATWGAEAG